MRVVSEGAEIAPLLAVWHAEPVPEAVARERYAEAERAYGEALRQGACAFLARWRMLTLRFWRGRSVTMDLLELRAACSDDARRALVELTFGQLLVSRGLEPGHGQLETGFRLAVSYLSARDYREVARRHRLLARLPLGSHARPPRGLVALMREAGVIERLEGGPPRQPLTDRERRGGVVD